ncbi:MAG: hypothetical protein ACYSTL_03260, partial [Planctomycetota bacterium]
SDGPDKPIGRQSYSYTLVQHRWLTPLLASILTGDASMGWRNPPDLHTVEHSIEIDFGKLGRFEVHDITDGRGIWAVSSDLTRAIVAMLNNPLGDPPVIERIAVKVRIERGSKLAEILQLKLDGSLYRPGETLSGKLIIHPFRQKRRELPVSFKLPDDLPDGSYQLTVCDSRKAASLFKQEKPHLFAPRTVGGLLESLRKVAEPRSDRLYLRLPLKQKGLARGVNELPNLPPSRTAILQQAGDVDTRAFSSVIVRSMATGMVLSGSAVAEFEVKDKPKQILIHQQKE